MDGPQTSVIVPADKTLAKMTKSVNAKLAKFEKVLGQAQKECVEIGKELIAIRSYIQDNGIEGGFDGWVRTCFRWGRSQAYRLIAAAEQFGDCPNLGHYDTSALYLLAAASTPETAKEEAEQIVEQGGFVDYTTASEIVEKHKETPVMPPYADEGEAWGEEEDAGKKRSRSRNRREPPLKWEYRCRKGGIYVIVTGTDDPSVAKEALDEALARITSQSHEQNTEAVMPPPGIFTGLLDDNDELEVDEEGNVVRSTAK